MPTSTRSKTFTRRKTFRRKLKPTAQVKGYHLNALRRQMWKLRPRPENKYFDIQRSDTIVSSGVVRALFTPFPGSGVDDIIGYSCWLKSWLMRIVVIPNSTEQLNYLRVIMFQDKQVNGSTPAVTDVLESASYISPLNAANWQRFKVRFDKLYTVDSDGNGSQVDKIFRKFRILYRGDSSQGITVTNGLYLLLISNQVTNGPQVDFHSRIKFNEI